MGWVFLAVAILSEVTGTLSLKASEGLTRLGPSVIVAAGYVTAFVMLAQALRTIGVGPAYATWSGLGTVGAAVGAWWLFGESLNLAAAGGIVLIIAGVAVLSLAGGH
jgi:small multidrug resistance pump